MTVPPVPGIDLLRRAAPAGAEADTADPQDIEASKVLWKGSGPPLHMRERAAPGQTAGGACGPNPDVYV